MLNAMHAQCVNSVQTKCKNPKSRSGFKRHSLIHLDREHTKHMKEVRIHLLVKKEPEDLLLDPPECPG